jgi:hypothetical protein
VVRIWLCHVHTRRIVASDPDPSPESVVLDEEPGWSQPRRIHRPDPGQGHPERHCAHPTSRLGETGSVHHSAPSGTDSRRDEWPNAIASSAGCPGMVV